jgi:hypothetical protein
MASLENNTIADTYPLLLKVDANGVDGTLRAVEGGEGTDTALKVSTGAVQVDNIKIDGNTISSTDTDGNIALSPNGSGVVTANITGTAATVTGAAQTSITRVGSSLGIGLAPTHNFNLQAAGTVEARFYSTDGDCSLQIASDTDEGQSSILAFNSATSTRGSVLYDHNATAASQKMQFLTGDNAVTAMTIDGSGNVGINNATPYRTLDIMSDDGSITYPLRVYNKGATGATHGVGIQFGCDYYGADGTGDEGKGALVYELSTSYARGKFHFLQNTDANRGGAVLADSVMTIQNDGKVGIGTTSPEQPLDVLGSIRIRSTVSNEDRFLLNPGGAGDDAILKMYNNAETNNIHLDASSGKLYFTGGELGIGTTSPTHTLDIEADGDNVANTATTATGISLYDSDTSFSNFNPCVIRAYTKDGAGSKRNLGLIAFEKDNDAFNSNLNRDGRIVFVVAKDTSEMNERMRITSDGDILFGTPEAVGTNKGGAMFSPNSVGRTILYLGSESYTDVIEVVRFYNQNGKVGHIDTEDSATAYVTSSDYRLKENEVAISDGLTRLNKLKPYRFNFKTKKDKTIDGFFAHEVSDIVPNAVMGEKDALEDDGEINPQGIDHSKLVPLLVSAVQELSAEVEALKNA